MLLRAGCRADALNGAQSTALHVAVQRGFLEVVRVLCECGCNVNVPVSAGAPGSVPGLRDTVTATYHLVTPVHHRQDAHGNTPLHCAISAGSGASGIVEALTAVPGIDVTATNSRGFTLLHHASLKGHVL